MLLPLLPNYKTGCLNNLVPLIFKSLGDDFRKDKGRDKDEMLLENSWLPREVLEASQVVLLVLDGFGYNQFVGNIDLLPNLSEFSRSKIFSVVPTTTSTALCSIATGATPFEHGIVGYRIRVGAKDIMNVLRWSKGPKDLRQVYAPESMQPITPFDGKNIPVVNKQEFLGTGFTTAHLRDTRYVGTRVISSMAVEIKRLLLSGEKFIYTYYDGIDKIAHEYGFGSHYFAELKFVDRLVGEVLSSLTPNAVLLVTADHGQVYVPDVAIDLGSDIMDKVNLLSGEGRFRWLHAKSGAFNDLLDTARDKFEKVAWVKSKLEMIDENWFGGSPSHEVADRLGDVALVASDNVAFSDPFDVGELKLMCRHGSLTEDEMVVPLLCSKFEN